MVKFKYGEKSVMSTLLDKNTYMKYYKLNTHREDSIGWLDYTHPVISLQRITRESISDALILVHLNDNEMQVISINSSDNINNLLKQNKLIIPVFDIHHKMIGNGNGPNRISTTALNIRCNPKYSSILQTLLARFLEDHNYNLTFIPYELTKMTNA